MKKLFFPLIAVVMIAFTFCKPTVDIEKEKEAIKAVFEAEKEGYFSQDASRMAETWVKDPSSVKLYMGKTGQQLFNGWDAVSKHDQSIVKDTTWNRKLITANYLDFQIDIIGDAAWVLSKAHFGGIMGTDTISLEQTRLNVLKKVDGKWKFSLMAIYNIPAEAK
jgi:hypothetical protein